MFLLNLFGRSNSSNEEKFDVISFKINLNDNVPQFQDWSEQNTIEEEELTPFHPLYYQIFPKEEEKYTEYTTNENDTLFGIAIKLDISEALIRSINNISGSIYPGMVTINSLRRSNFPRGPTWRSCRKCRASNQRK
jgi:hypothetical protein